MDRTPNHQISRRRRIGISVPNVVYYRGILNRYWDRLEQAKSLLNLDHILIRFEVDGQEEVEKAAANHVEDLQTNVATDVPEDVGGERVARGSIASAF